MNLVGIDGKVEIFKISYASEVLWNMTEDLFPGKEKRIEHMSDTGLNTPKQKYVPRGEYIEEKVEDFFKEYNAITVRTFSEGDYSTPFLYREKDLDRAKEFCRENNEEYELLLTEVIDIEKTEVTGNISWPKYEPWEKNFIVEYVECPDDSGVTPRKIDSGTTKEFEKLSGAFKELDELKPNTEIREIIERTKKAIHNIPIKYYQEVSDGGLVFEFSKFEDGYRVGEMENLYIFWEFFDLQDRTG